MNLMLFLLLAHSLISPKTDLYDQIDLMDLE